MTFVAALGLALSVGSPPACAQTTAQTQARCTDLDGKPEDCPKSQERGSTQDQQRSKTVSQDATAFFRGTWSDQCKIWTSPARLRWKDLEWIAPLSGITTGLIMTDRASSFEAGRNHHRQISDDFSNAGVGVLGATAGWLYLRGVHRGDDKSREAGRLSLEAGLDALVVDEGLKYVFRRARPGEDSGSGRFFTSNNPSFPSGHATTAFAMATVLANEYPSTTMQVLAYGSASAISLARVTAHQHYPSDVFVGAAMGYFIGRTVYKRHHDSALEDIGTFATEPAQLSIRNMSSTYIELDSWMYPAVEKLVAKGLVDKAFLGLRPWTRLAVWQMLADVDVEGADPATADLVSALRTELQRESDLDGGQPNKAISLDRVYLRTQNIAGKPLNDSFHFGQTIVDDFGRPYGQGLQQITGFESHAESGRFSFYVRGEYQHSPSVPGYSASVAQVIANQDAIPQQTYPNRPAGDAFRLLDTYVSMKLWGQEISVGKQSLWWGPGSGSAMMLSNNAEPFYALRINSTEPTHIPGLSKLIGPVRVDNFFGKLSGHQFPRQPFFYGQKINFQPTRNLEVGFSRDAVIAGDGSSPLTFDTFLRSFFSVHSGTTAGSTRNIYGVRHGSFDFRYRLPWLREWVTLYADSLVHDDVSPVDAPRHAAVTSGIYLAKFPRLYKLDLHVEGGTTDPATRRAEGGKFFYWEGIYRDAYLNKSNLMGSWLGREGTGGTAWLTYWLKPDSKLVVGFRTLKVSNFFVPGGETQHDGFAEVSYAWRNGVGVHVFVQAERWAAPILSSTPQTNVTSQFQISFSPKNTRWMKRATGDPLN